ncbi:zinc-dependent alcohol dehydrogenase [Streptomyces acidiscabies]|uniref:2-deoxy-scyllo-inosamine dehydrogenase n=1 Tax=Streptomyces acidiscabies TaxID=42234 RepID=A0AAP6BHN6_9ACTN|nr:alcohol dehydrogenase catalytic domain-containing protein [Streptomyces acidiscabies]MBP5935253.1 alcohol dehydrogenase catalytic domain-containing protein [Streptomyces sp. LBUM 1476]MBZ3916915.1 alcohol dehydrogenase catalytic domain-containing protein [Streptomyces acidiscabies]MDX2964934.1 alcohol dehydrogenase catalytic domain-containing protein [Streptomyces acidiscabies]MDX3024225.1 alcohol dehydrogenase catalytic domain-containing protein [Streptomyces acidiscabies]MDX3793032.1 alco
MRAFVLTAPGAYEVADLPAPEAAPGEVVVDVERAGVCGTDVEFYTGHMAYLHQGYAAYPLRPGHEWCGCVRRVGPGVDRAWLGRRVMGDTMLGCGDCRRCRRGRQHVCDRRQEVGVRGGRAGALAEQLAVPASSLHALPDEVDAELGALVEPGGNALRAARATGAGPDDRVLVLGPGTIGLLTALFLRAQGAEVHLLGVTPESLSFSRALGFTHVWQSVPDLPYDAVVDASTATELPARALELVEPSGRLVYIGLAREPSLIDTRTLVLKDVTVTGVLSASPGLDPAIRAYAEGVVDPRPLVAATVGLDQVGAVLGGKRPAESGPGPKVLVDPAS